LSLNTNGEENRDVVYTKNMSNMNFDPHKDESHKSEEDMPRRVAPRLEGVVKNKGTSKRNLKKGK